MSCNVCAEMKCRGHTVPSSSLVCMMSAIVSRGFLSQTAMAIEDRCKINVVVTHNCYSGERYGKRIRAKAEDVHHAIVEGFKHGITSTTVDSDDTD